MKKRYSTGWSLAGLAWSPIYFGLIYVVGPQPWWAAIVGVIIWLWGLAWLYKKSGGLDAV